MHNSLKSLSYPFGTERVQALRGFYDVRYSTGVIKHDSPDRTRRELVRTIAGLVTSQHAKFEPHNSPLTVLNLGSGPQALEKEYFQYATQRPDVTQRVALCATQFVSLDIARIPTKKLLLGSKIREVSVPHLRSSSSHIPLEDESVDVAVSNMSIDMLRVTPNNYDKALTEVARVVKPTGTVITNLHHYDLYQAYAQSPDRNSTSPKGTYFNPLAHNPFYFDEADIVTDFALNGLQVDVLRLENDNADKWWHVEARKAPEF